MVEKIGVYVCPAFLHGSVFVLTGFSGSFSVVVLDDM